MLTFVVLQLCITPIYCWVYTWVLGYHGVFALILINLAISTYFALWNLYYIWIFDYNYILDLANWIELGNSNLINYILSADFLASAILVIMTSGSFIVLLFVYVEMWDDKEGANFAILLVSFLAFMAILASSGNLFIFYLGWEGIGLISLFLISFWSERARAIKATLKVYTINKIGDFLILIGISLLFIHLGNTEFFFLNSMSILLNNYDIFFGDTRINIIELTSSLFVIGGGVKSAQFGFHIWLLEAMEAPLGASALMHSSTLVVAGITLVYKLSEFIDYSLIAHYILLIWGSWTAFFAAFVACWQFELKIILAYSTISSMGFLYYLLGLNAHSEMLIYLIIHAYIKIFLFLVIGAIILHCNGCQDIRWMGGLLHYIPGLYVCYVAGSLGLAGIPYWSGYYCKSAVWNWTIQTANFGKHLQFLLLCTTFCTYIYLIRTGILVFLGQKNGHQSIYRNRQNSYIVLIAFCILMLVVGYSGVIWVRMSNTSFNNIQITLTHYYSLVHQLGRWQSYFSWWGLTTIYILFFSLVFFLVLILLNNNLKNIYSWYILNCLFIFVMLIYICF